MSLFRRKNSKIWWIELSDPSGKRVQKSTGTEVKSLAQEYHDRLKSQFWEQKRLGVKPRRTWQEAVVKYLDEKSLKASIASDHSHLRWLNSHLHGKFLDEIDRETIAGIIAARWLPYEIPRTKGPARKINPKASTVNRTMEVVRAILRMARDDLEWIDKFPRVPMQKKSQRRVSWITRDQAETLLKSLPEHKAIMMRFALETGLRRSNLTYIEWSQINIEARQAWIHADQSKTGLAIGVPLSNDAVAILKQQVGKHPVYVFPYKGKPVKQTATRAWRNALVRAGIPKGFTWHDLRHTWASWHVQDGTPLQVLMELGGWACFETVLKYAHLATDHLAHHVDKRSGLRFLQTPDVFPTEQRKRPPEGSLSL